MYSNSLISLQHADATGSGSCPVVSRRFVGPERTPVAKRIAALSSRCQSSRDFCAISIIVWARNLVVAGAVADLQHCKLSGCSMTERRHSVPVSSGRPPPSCVVTLVSSIRAPSPNRQCFIVANPAVSGARYNHAEKMVELACSAAERVLNEWIRLEFCEQLRLLLTWNR